MPVYIVAGDEMQKIMKGMFPERETIPFREDLSKGSTEKRIPDDEFIRERAAFWGVSEAEYRENFDGILKLNPLNEYILCFGEDDCCRANLAFMIAYLKAIGYEKPIRVMIVNEITLEVIREYEA